MVSGVTKLATGTYAFVGTAGIEAEFLDSLSGHRLAAAIDERAGGRSLRGGNTTWSDVQNAFDFWAAQMRTRLAELSGRGAG